MLIASCDKIVPGMLMAAARSTFPSVLVRRRPDDVRYPRGDGLDLSDMFEAVGAHSSGRISAEDLPEMECAGRCPGAGSSARGCSLPGSMNCLAEALGMASSATARFPPSKAGVSPLRVERARPQSSWSWQTGRRRGGSSPLPQCVTPSPWTWPSVAPATRCCTWRLSRPKQASISTSTWWTG